jgi:DNA-binding transcriptional LysR family regulator
MSRAAERLGVTQPALTLAIKRLEDSFGQQVLLRSKTGVTLTRAGEKLVLQARSIIDEWNRISVDAAKDEAEVRGRYTIGCHVSVGMYTLTHFIPELLKDHSDLEIKLTHDLSRKITEDVISFKVDFGIVVNPVPHPELVLKQLFTDRVGFWSGPGKVQKNVLIYDPDLLQSQQLLRDMNKKGHVFQRTLTSSSLEVITSLVGSGVGIGILPTRVATRAKSPQLKLLDKDFPFFEDKIYLIFRADAQKSKASRHIGQKIQSLLSKENSF